MTVLHSRRGDRKGAATVEFAVLMLVLLPPLISGIWEVGRLIMVQNVLDNAAREGARRAASGSFYASNNNNNPSGGQLNLPSPSLGSPAGYCELQSYVITYLQNAGLNTTGTTVQVQNKTQGWSFTYSTSGGPTGTGYDPAAAANQLDDLLVTVTIPYSSVTWSPLNLFIAPNTNMIATAEWYSGRNIPVTVSTGIPNQPLQ